MDAAIFDLDGTLLDSMSVWQDKLYTFLVDKGVTPPADLINITKTLGTAQAITMMIQLFKLDLDPIQTIQDFNAQMAVAYAHTLPLKPFARDYLAQLEAAGIPMVIATATDRPLVLAVLARLEISHLFRFIVTVGEIGIGKHDPAIFLYCSQKLALAPTRCTVFEDSLKAIQSANAAGFQTIAIDEPTAILEKEALLSQAGRYLYSFQELL